MKRFVVASTGYSGTHYLAALFNNLGINTGHEHIFNPFNKNILKNGIVDWKEKTGEVSWESCFYLDKLPKGAIVFQQTRDPLKVLRAFIRVGFFEKPYPHRIWAEKHLDDLSSLEKYDKYLYWYYTLNKLMEKYVKGNRYKVEDIEIPLLQTIVRQIDMEELILDKKVSEVLAVINQTSKTLNSHATPEDDLITWDTFPNSAMKEKVQDMAVRYGYVISN